MNLDEAIRASVREAVAAALEDLELTEAEPAGEPEEEGWRSRVHRVHEDTRLGLGEVAEALDVSERTVRRYLAGDGERPELPHRRGPVGITVRAGDLRTWLRDVEEGQRFREVGRGA